MFCSFSLWFKLPNFFSFDVFFQIDCYWSSAQCSQSIIFRIFKCTCFFWRLLSRSAREVFSESFGSFFDTYSRVITPLSRAINIRAAILLAIVVILLSCNSFCEDFFWVQHFGLVRYFIWRNKKFWSNFFPHQRWWRNNTSCLLRLLSKLQTIKHRQTESLTFYLKLQTLRF